MQKATIDKHVTSLKNNPVPKAELDSFYKSISVYSKKHPLDCVNDHLRPLILESFNEGLSKAQFKKNILKNTPYTSKGFNECHACQYLVNKLK